ncbi:MAG TPA: DNA-primase RepB domain-containing protein [Acidobacteriota bacterium]|nr:DNA-primase RepB domain-containing protein [Acidobacteriota bacterium]
MRTSFITSWVYINDNFEPMDRLAVVIKHQQRHDLIQRLVTAGQLAGPRYQAWLRFQNALGGDLFVSMNPLKPDARSRTKQDIAMVRHLYLDLDHDGTNALAGILNDPRLPRPSYVLNTSPGKHQVIWKVSGFTPEQAEGVQRAMVSAHGADRAATDVTRVLRIPGYYNRKYDPPCVVTAEKLSDGVNFPSDFRIEPQVEGLQYSRSTADSRARVRPGPASQSERDWAETLSRLEQGENPAAVQVWLRQKRQDKPNPEFYAALTVRKAVVELERRRSAGSAFEPC